MEKISMRMRNRKGNTQRRVINARNELRQVTHGTHQNPGHTYIHACIHAHTARIGKTSLYFNGVHDCIHFPFFFSFFIPYFLFSFFLYSILCILLFLFLPYLHRRMDGWVDGCIQTNRGVVAYKRHGGTCLDWC
ncbi:hypothetical protein M747DRAFT_148860 [Aspergillus niger ATCC 13496]|uniref:Uncharacterized protein n=1 Tax=Aspergillus niger ATCC 13496 TaxID=1353008 RepID=A0A370BH78_ASPNG|nr:hypothetical protein M747DRAFT_148860 [Aspergillus niger ATCC 13496]